MIKFSPIIILNLIIFSFFLCEIKSANIDKFNIPEVKRIFKVKKKIKLRFINFIKILYVR